MSEMPSSSNESTPGTETPEDLADEFKNLGKNLKSILLSVWESPERKKLQQEIETGLTELEKSLNQAVKEVHESPAGQQFKSNVKDFSERIRGGEVDTKVREELLSALRKVNAELEKTMAPKSPPESPKAETQEDG